MITFCSFSQSKFTGVTNYLKSINFMGRYFLLFFISFWHIISYANNDECSNVVQLTPSIACNNTTGTFQGMTLSGTAPLCAPNTSQDVWYKFTATEQTMSITAARVTFGSTMYLGFEIREDSCSGPVFKCINEYDTVIHFDNNFVVGKTYFIRFFNPSATLSTRSFTICVQSYVPPANDLCANAVQLTPNASCVTTTGSFSGSMMNDTAPLCAPNTSQDVWYKFTATEQTMSITAARVTLGSTMYLGFEIREDSCSGPVFKCINEYDTVIHFANNFVVGKTYFIRVFNPSATLSTRSFTICVQSYVPPANDICANAVQLTPNASCVTTSGTFSGSMINDTVPLCAPNTSQDVWYKFTATEQTMSITAARVTLGSTMYLGFEIREDSCSGPVFNCINEYDTVIHFANNFVVGKTYFVRVFNPSATLITRSFTICVRSYAPPVNDACANAIQLMPSATCVNTTGNFSGATMDVGIPGCAANTSQDVWYKFVATSSNMGIQLAAVNGLNHGFQVFEGTCNGTEISCINNNGTGLSESVNLTALTVGTTYFVRVINASATINTGNFSICLTGPPPAACTPSVAITASTTSICSGTTVVFNAIPTYGGSSPSYQWKVNGNNVGTNSPSYTTTTLTDGSTVSCVMTSNAACAFPTTATSNAVNIAVSGLITPGFTQIPTVCSGQSFSLSLSSDNGITGIWTPAINTTATTTYTFTPNAGQCASTTTMTVTVNNVTPAFTQISAVCSGQSFTLPTTSNNGITGTWSPAVNNTATTTYTFTPNTGQCASTVTMTVTVNNVIPVFTQVASVCPGQTFVLPVASNNGITGTWSPGVNNTATTTYTFTPNAGQCASTTTMTVTVNTNSVLPAFTQVAPICTGQTFVLPTTSNNGVTGTWNPAVNNTATTTYTFTPNTGQCALTTTMTVTVNMNNNVVPVFTQIAAICSGQTLVLPTTSNNGVTGTWSPGVNNTVTTTYTFTPNAGQCASAVTMTVTVNTGNIVPTFTQVVAICSGQSFTLPATSNNGIMGTWSPAVNNMATTTYTFTPNTGQCASTTTMTVAVNNSTLPTFTQVAAICSGQSFTLPATSNNGISGTWSPAINNTITKTYTFTPNVGQCALTTTMTVTVNASNSIIPVFTQVAPICSGQSFTLPTTSNNGINGAWSPAINSNITITYTFIPNNGQCAAMTTMKVIVNDKVIPTFTQVMPICSGQSFMLPTISNNGISGTWSPAINNTVTKIYTFTPASGECAQTTTMLVIVNSVNAEVKTEGNTITATATDATYQWVNCADNQPISGETNSSFTPTAIGSYAVAVTQNGCSETSDCITITELGVDTFTRHGWNIYPNPVTDQLFIDLNEAIEIVIVDMTGKTIQRETLKSGNNIVNVNSLSSGVYIIKSTSGANVKFVKK